MQIIAVAAVKSFVKLHTYKIQKNWADCDAQIPGESVVTLKDVFHFAQQFGEVCRLSRLHALL